jgi:predicted RNase H-like nuclease (RuvC/YqgF family)
MVKSTYEHARQMRHAIDTGITGFERSIQSLSVRKEHFKNKYTDTECQNKKLRISLTLAREEIEELKNKHKVLEQKYENLKQKLEELSNNKSDTDEEDSETDEDTYKCEFYSSRASRIQDFLDNMLTECFETLHRTSPTYTDFQRERQLRRKGVDICNRVANLSLFTGFSWTEKKRRDRSVAAGIAYFLIRKYRYVTQTFMFEHTGVTTPVIVEIENEIGRRID